MDLRSFVFERVLLQEPEHCRLTVLGSFPPNQQAILRIEKTAVPLTAAADLPVYLRDAQCVEHTDIYMWFAAWLAPSSFEDLPQGDVKVNVICPATEAHIRKYSPQNYTILHETPQMYRDIVAPFIASLPPERTKWVQDILDGRKEQSKVLFSSSTFLILPDMKWDLHTLSSLYLVAIVRDALIKSLRDLRIEHLPLLKDIRKEAARISREKWGIEAGGLRMFIHYHPTYYHFHVHIVHSGYDGGLGMRVGQAHLLDDVISLLELDTGNPTPLFERRTLVYSLGEQHGLYEALRRAQDSDE
uniref:Scavenger mRNA decapping enzyme n=1 Tax=Mycena chlorophos TaxID=658473 RepID=A0ABQ0L6D3_MYCCL|nr:scavenger mRNA decapping enzyme [Mycena chlorophos]